MLVPYRVTNSLSWILSSSKFGTTAGKVMKSSQDNDVNKSRVGTIMKLELVV
jgi:hypothetical protein